ncbi:MAG: isoprenyl transferase [Flavobacteriales bacterium]|nr:isoprenyl transferase [Flavobacteriales bacterium]|tara:strand:+ start:270 stop:992 length:723 start_codon:yes stop_codon:yes gene_type:complete
MKTIDKNNIPNHIAIIMDGNGRWAKKKGKLRAFGHKNGVGAVRETVESCAELGVKHLTLYAFSTENWNRPTSEVNALMSLLISAIVKETKTLMKNDIQLNAIGNLNDLPESAFKKLKTVINKTKNNSRMNLILALSYSGRWEIINAIKKIMKDSINYKKINDEIFKQYLTTKLVPEPELLIRTGGEKRISNFLLWQIAYTELYFTETLWPDFKKIDLEKAIMNYQSRERRFGKITEQLQK